MALYLREHLSFDRAQIKILEEEASGYDGKPQKNLYLEGICIEGDVRNENQRVYPMLEIKKAVEQINETIREGKSVLGEVDHPDDLKINLDRVSHMITSMWMDGPCGHGKLKILPTPMGELIKAMIISGVKLGVSSRGSGEVADNGRVSGFDIITVDIVAQPSAPHAYPKAIYEGLMNMRHGHRVLDVARDATQDQRVQKYLKEGITRLINDLKLK
jgi:hypothetical protein